MDRGAEPETSSVSVPVIVGSLVLGVPYATGLGIAASESFENGSGWLAAPVAGPWLALAGRRDPCDGLSNQTKFDSDVGRCVAEPMVRGMLVLDGVLQATGAVLIIVGASSSSSEPEKPPPPRMMAMPSRVGRDGYGLGVVGQF
ncbi:MAG: hypothetical protein KC776_40810 [Myxococcales bacterium]|nr:hypothetical protein [Myxococcales bacterium]MCB9580418.1 hypothetical protein [Polyangiaceae bacterium]